MQLGRVIGTVVATRKNDMLHGAKLLIVRPVSPGGEWTGTAILAVDSVGAGVGETVLTVLEGRAAGEALGRRGAPVDAAVIGIVDQLQHDPSTGDRAARSPRDAQPAALGRGRRRSSRAHV